MENLLGLSDEELLNELTNLVATVGLVSDDSEVGTETQERVRNIRQVILWRMASDPQGWAREKHGLIDLGR